MVSHFFNDLFNTRAHCYSSFLKCHNEIEQNQMTDVTPNKPSKSILKNFLRTQINDIHTDTYSGCNDTETDDNHHISGRHCNIHNNLVFQSIHYIVKGFLQRQMEDSTSIQMMIDNGCTLPFITVQYYQQHKDTMSKCKHSKVSSSTVVRLAMAQ